MVKDLAKKAELKTPPKVKTSSSLPDYAKASFLSKHITVNFKLISKWEKGEIDDDYVESVLAHETGHIIDLNRGIRSLYLRLIVVTVLYLVLIIFLMPASFFSLTNGNLGISLSLFVVWLIFLPWVCRRSQFASEFEADRNASLIIDEQKLAKTLIILLEHPAPFRSTGFKDTWKALFLQMFPSPRERLHNLHYETKITVQVQKHDYKKT
jgi:Zn-dependent protease with chaperone function